MCIIYSVLRLWEISDFNSIGDAREIFENFLAGCLKGRTQNSGFILILPRYGIKSWNSIYGEWGQFSCSLKFFKIRRNSYR